LKGKQVSNSNNEDPNTSGWLTTFNDLVTLLMVFFVLVFAMSAIDVTKLKNFQTSLQSGLGVLEAGQKLSVGLFNPLKQNPHKDFEDPSTDSIEVKPESKVSDEVEKSLAALESEIGIKTTFVTEGILITLDDSILFDFGKAEVNSRSYPVLAKIVDVIKIIHNPVRIEGHTDNVPIRTERFPSNWELSTARAVQVLKYFAEVGEIEPQRLSAAGYGDVKSVFPNDTPEHRAKNRRVEILLVTEDEK
jgi:chemotaxis protein MotB